MSLLARCRIDSFFGCIPLQRGCIIIGCCELLWRMLDMVKYTLQFVDFELNVMQCGRDVKLTQENLETDHDVGSGAHAEPLSVRDCPSARRLEKVRILMGLTLSIVFIKFFVTIMMIIGSIKRKARLMVPFIAWMIVEVIFDTADMVFGGLSVRHQITVSLYMFAVAAIILEVYFFIAVYSYYLEVRDTETGQFGMTVMAVSQAPNEMMVVIPTGPKDDLPQYSSIMTTINPGYDPLDNEAISVPRGDPPRYSSIMSASNPVYDPFGSGEVDASNIVNYQKGSSAAQQQPNMKPSEGEPSRSSEGDQFLMK